MRYQHSNHPFLNEARFRGWVVDCMRGQKWHAQPLEDRLSVGIPDLSAAHELVGECWMELKLGRGVRPVNDKMAYRYPPTSQQEFWLKRRADTVIDTYAGFLVGFSTGLPKETIDYVSWVSILEWKERSAWTTMTWCLHRHTAMLSWLQRGECTFVDVVLGNLTPGWREVHNG